MGRCLHIAPAGDQCGREAAPGADLCFLHEPAPVDEFSGGPPPLRKTVFRLVAALLLILFALQTYQFLKALLGD